MVLPSHQAEVFQPAFGSVEIFVTAQTPIAFIQLVATYGACFWHDVPR